MCARLLNSKLSAPEYCQFAERDFLLVESRLKPFSFYRDSVEVDRLFLKMKSNPTVLFNYTPTI